MRILGGKYKGRRLVIPEGIRPTQDKVRKALFDILADVEGASFLELFAGSGAVGFEALSRGAASLTLAESSRESVRAIGKNAQSLVVADCNLMPFEAEAAVKTLFRAGRKFDIIFLDPPYYKELAKKTLQILEAYDILAPNGFVVVQHFKRDQLPKSCNNLFLIKESRYGDTVLSFYRRNVPESDISGDV